jgi:hypothetical protein
MQNKVHRNKEIEHAFVANSGQAYNSKSEELYKYQ